MSWSPEQLRAALNDAADILPETTALMFKHGKSFEAQWRANAAATSGSHARNYPSTITSDPPSMGFGAIEVEVGPLKQGQGNLGHLLEDGSVYSPPHSNGKRAVEDELPKLEKSLIALAVKKLW